MNKIPTLFRRDPANMARVTREVHLDCQWVLDGEGEPTRKYDGTCVMFDGEQWWARREVKPGKQAPAGFVAVETDGVTGKTMGWEPAEQSAFFKYLTEAIERGPLGANEDVTAGQTYELVGPKVNGNPEQIQEHLLVRHGYFAAVDYWEMESLPRDFDGVQAWLLAHPKWEGIVWHHPDGRMAKIKRKDFAPTP